MDEELNNDQEKELETIERFLNGTMIDAELQSFENLLESDPRLKREVEQHKLLILGMEAASLKMELDEYHQTMGEENQKVIPLSKKKPKRQWYFIAASLVTFLGLGLFYFTTTSNQRLFEQYFEPDPGLATNMSTNKDFEFIKAMVYYKEGEYEKAIERWTEQLPYKKENDTLNYFLGVSHLAIGNEEEAIKYLETVKQKKNSYFLNDTHYYLGLSYLKNDDIELAKENLTITTYQNAELILSKLRK